ncbi:hypothetical protein [Mycoplana ramosa]|uniref:Uncharacterized protein n=1 Tax=Mycoplana ramosa TaxID=40837 RepID=A0ABW3YUT7_MYCRA
MFSSILFRISGVHFRSRCLEHAVELLSASLESSAFYGPATEDNLLRLHNQASDTQMMEAIEPFLFRCQLAEQMLTKRVFLGR